MGGMRIGLSRELPDAAIQKRRRYLSTESRFKQGTVCRQGLVPDWPKKEIAVGAISQRMPILRQEFIEVKDTSFVVLVGFLFLAIKYEFRGGIEPIPHDDVLLARDAK